MISLLLACLSSQPIDAEPEPGSIPEFPTWSGTQIGEEGDEACSLMREDWTDEEIAPPGTDWTPDELRSQLGGDYSGTFQSAWQGDEALTATVTLDGAAQALYDPMELCAPAMAVDGTLMLSTETLLSLQLPITVIARYDRDVGFLDVAEEAALTGALSPGQLPDDALALSIEIQGGLTESGWAGELVWTLQRESGTEASPAGTWSVQ